MAHAKSSNAIMAHYKDRWDEGKITSRLKRTVAGTSPGESKVEIASGDDDLADEGYRRADDLPYRFNWSYDFGHPVEKVWDMVSNTDRLNRAVGLSTVDFRYEPDPVGGSKVFGKFRVLAFNLEWLERPYEWVRHKFMSVDREYVSGPLKKMRVEWNFIPTDSGCRVGQTISYRPSTWIHGLIGRVEVGVKTRRQFLKTYAHIDRYLSDQNTTPFSKRRDDGINLGVQILTMFRDKLMELGLSSEIADRMATFILHSQPHDLVRIRPFQLAKIWGMDWLEVLSAFLRAARGGIFNVSWDLLCPRCRGAKLRARSLYDLEKQAHCETCNITYDANFDRSVELSFTVSPSVREVDIGEYCVGGPQNTPHILMQFRIPPGEKKIDQIFLNEGKYVFRSPHSKGRYVLDATSSSQVEQTSPQSISQRSSNGIFRIDFSDENYKETFIEVPIGNVAFEIVNSHQREIRVYLENAAWFEDACTAAFVTSLQEFRDLFSSEVLRPGQEISVQNLTVLFTDLKGSTSMYKTVGDATAYSIVQDHFDALTDIVRKHMGGVVKTMGDAILAVFTKPEDAMRAAIEMHEIIQNVGLKGDKKEKLILKIGIHTGPCYAVNQNERLDYFGSTLNISSRVEAHCEGGDILVSEKMYEMPAVQRVIEDSRKQVLKLTRNLKGFDEEFTLYQIKCIED